MTDKYTPGRIGDYVTFCDICGQKCWSSESRIQDVYTGRGGTLACPECADPVDYGLVPYTIPAEKPVPMARDTTQIANPASIPQTYAAYDAAYKDPMTVTPESWKQFATFGYDWVQITDDWSTITVDWATPNYGVVPGGIELDEDGDIGFPEFPSDD